MHQRYLFVRRSQGSLIALRPTSNLGDRFGPVYPRPAWLKVDAHRRSCARACSVRACRAVGTAENQRNCPGFHRPARERLLRAVRGFFASRYRSTPHGRADPRRSQGHRALYAGHPPLFVDRRRRTRAADRRRVRPEGHGRRLDRQGQGAQRAGNPLRPRARPPQQQRQRHRRRQRDHAARRHERRRPDPAASSG